MTFTKDISLKDLLDSYDISTRAFKACNFHGLKTVRDLHNYILKHNGFENLRNCGKKTDRELKEIDRKYFADILETINEPELAEMLN
jgi:2-hydroxy-3-keto-5-methylthiopentenyl-1-phosphate phosphatase